MMLYLFGAFGLGMCFQKWDSKYGSYYGHKWGQATREFFISDQQNKEDNK